MTEETVGTEMTEIVTGGVTMTGTTGIEGIETVTETETGGQN